MCPVKCEFVCVCVCVCVCFGRAGLEFVEFVDNINICMYVYTYMYVVIYMKRNLEFVDKTLMVLFYAFILYIGRGS